MKRAISSLICALLFYQCTAPLNIQKQISIALQHYEYPGPHHWEIITLKSKTHQKDTIKVICHIDERTNDCEDRAILKVYQLTLFQCIYENVMYKYPNYVCAIVGAQCGDNETENLITINNKHFAFINDDGTKDGFTIQPKSGAANL